MQIHILTILRSAGDLWCLVGDDREVGYDLVQQFIYAEGRLSDDLFGDAQGKSRAGRVAQ